METRMRMRGSSVPLRIFLTIFFLGGGGVTGADGADGAVGSFLWEILRGSRGDLANASRRPFLRATIGTAPTGTTTRRNG